MDIRKVTRNPGWWRLFLVLAGLWYGSWLVGGVVMFSEEIFNREPIGNDRLAARETYEIMNVTRKAELRTIDVELADGTILEFPDNTDPEVIRAAAKHYTQTQLALLEEELALIEEIKTLEARIDLIPPPKPWYRDIDVLGTIAAIILFPWIVFFNLRLMRYVIEGFIPERE